jgi:molybdopterin converting factor subunit 1
LNCPGVLRAAGAFAHLEMTVTVLLFASYADALGKSTLELPLPAGATVREVLDRLSSLPGAAALPPAPLVAVNQEYASADHRLRAGDEVAIIPPVAGG